MVFLISSDLEYLEFYINDTNDSEEFHSETCFIKSFSNGLICVNIKEYKKISNSQ